MSWIRKMFCASLVTLALNSSVLANEVMGWVPSNPDRRDKIIPLMDANPHIVAGLNRVGLQLWHVTSTGGLTFTTEFKTVPTKAEAQKFVDYFQGKNIQVLGTIYNAKQSWDWQMFNDALNNPDALAQACVDLVTEYGLDGIDVDLELLANPTAEYRTKYKVMLEKLSAKLKPMGKVLTVDTFFSDCDNVPNQAFWADWVGIVDHIHSMGYQSMFEGYVGKHPCSDVVNPFKYSSQVSEAKKMGYRADQISMGMPASMASWGSGGLGSSPSNHIDEVLSLAEPASIALWDLALADGAYNPVGAWTATDVWDKLAKLKAMGTPIAHTTSSITSKMPSQIFPSTSIAKTTTNYWTPQQGDLGKSLEIFSASGKLMGSQRIQNLSAIELPGVAQQVRILKVK